VTYWDTVAETKWGTYLAAVEKRLVALGHERASRVGAGIDLGCGSGRWSRQLADLGWQMTCVDVVAEDLAVCQRNVPEARCVLSPRDSATIPCDSRSAGMLLCIEVAPVIDSAWFIPEVHRVLSDGGILVGVLCNQRSWRGLAVRIKSRLKAKQTGYPFYQHRYRDFRGKLIAAGFEMLHEEGYCWGPAGRCSDSALVPIYTKLEQALHLNRWVSFSPWVAFIARKH
jgi:SAM-dependent methyltransferase